MWYIENGNVLCYLPAASAARKNFLELVLYRKVFCLSLQSTVWSEVIEGREFIQLLKHTTHTADGWQMISIIWWFSTNWKYIYLSKMVLSLFVYWDSTSSNLIMKKTALWYRRLNAFFVSNATSEHFTAFDAQAQVVNYVVQRPRQHC